MSLSPHVPQPRNVLPGLAHTWDRSLLILAWCMLMMPFCSAIVEVKEDVTWHTDNRVLDEEVHIFPHTTMTIQGRGLEATTDPETLDESSSPLLLLELQEGAGFRLYENSTLILKRVLLQGHETAKFTLTGIARHGKVSKGGEESSVIWEQVHCRYLEKCVQTDGIRLSIARSILEKNVEPLAGGHAEATPGIVDASLFVENFRGSANEKPGNWRLYDSVFIRNTDLFGTGAGASTDVRCTRCLVWLNDEALHFSAAYDTIFLQNRKGLAIDANDDLVDPVATTGFVNLTFLHNIQAMHMGRAPWPMDRVNVVKSTKYILDYTGRDRLQIPSENIYYGTTNLDQVHPLIHHSGPVEETGALIETPFAHALVLMLKETKLMKPHINLSALYMKEKLGNIHIDKYAFHLAAHWYSHWVASPQHIDGGGNTALDNIPNFDTAKALFESSPDDWDHGAALSVAEEQAGEYVGTAHKPEPKREHPTSSPTDKAAPATTPTKEGNKEAPKEAAHVSKDPAETLCKYAPKGTSRAGHNLTTFLLLLSVIINIILGTALFWERERQGTNSKTNVKVLGGPEHDGLLRIEEDETLQQDESELGSFTNARQPYKDSVEKDEGESPTAVFL